MEKQITLTPSEWNVMERLWEKEATLMELVAQLRSSVGWSKSTVSTMAHRMVDKGIISYRENGRTKVFIPAVSREAVVARETDSLLNRAYQGSVGLLVSAMAQRNSLTREDIDALYAILKEAEESV